MARCRKLSTAISLDLDVNRLDDFSALLYTWLLPHAEDDCSIPSQAEVIRAQVMPLRKVKPGKIEQAIQAMLAAELLVECSDGKLRFEPESFYKYQTYINAQKRFPAENSKNQQRTARNSTSLSLSPSLSPSPSKDKPLSLDEGVLGYWCDKAGREPTEAEANSLRVLCKNHSPEVVKLAIGQAVVQGEPPTSFALITTIAKAEAR